MIGRETRVLLRHYLEQGMSKAAIARQVGVSRRTVYRWIESGQLDRELDDEAVKYGPRRPRPSKLDPYKGIVRARLAEYPELSAVRLFQEIQAAGYPGGLPTGDPERRDPLLPARQPALRPRLDRPDLQQGLRGVGPHPRRRGHGRRAPRPAPPPLPHRQHPRQQLPDAAPRGALQGHPRCTSPGRVVCGPESGFLHSFENLSGRYMLVVRGAGISCLTRLCVAWELPL